MDDNDTNPKPKAAQSLEAIRFLCDPETAKLFAAQRGISLDEAMIHLRAMAETIEKRQK